MVIAQPRRRATLNWALQLAWVAWGAEADPAAQSEVVRLAKARLTLAWAMSAMLSTNTT
jgi:hypothetical protein